MWQLCRGPATRGSVASVCLVTLCFWCQTEPCRRPAQKRVDSDLGSSDQPDGRFPHGACLLYLILLDTLPEGNPLYQGQAGSVAA